MERTEVYKLIDGERAYQEKRWADSVTMIGDRNHSPEEWLVYMEDYINEAKHILSREASPECYTKAMGTIRKITAMGVCAMEQMGAPAREGY